MPNVIKVAPFILFLLVAAWSVAAFADPPRHTPAHGWRQKHDPYYVGCTGKHWEHDYGILSGHCNREAVATILGGVIGGVIGSKVGDDDNRSVAIIIGAAAGALIGNKIGRELDDADRSCFGHALEVGKPGQMVTSNNQTYAKAYAIELNQIRKMRNMIGGAKLAMEQIQIRLNTVSELGDVIVTLSPAMSIIKGLSTSLGGLMPEANAYMEDLSNMLGDVIKGSTVSSLNSLSIADNNSTETYAILEEAHNIIEGRAKASIPEVPSELKEEVELKKEAFI